MSYTIDQVRDRLFSLDEAREILATTEPLTTIPLSIPHDDDQSAHFRLSPGWNHNLDSVDGLSTVDAYVSISGREYQLTKDALLEAGSICGLPKAYTSRTPALLIEPQLNFWYLGGNLANDYKALTREDTVLAVNKNSILPFSNQRLVTEVLEGIEQKYGRGEIFVDKKMQHSLRSTRLRLIIPENQRVIEHTGTDNDSWSVGIQIANSLAGEHQTSIDGYLFRYWCTNGSIDTHASSGTWSRRAGQSDEVYEWARLAVDDVLGGLEHSLDAIQELAVTSTQGSTSEVLKDIFEQYKIPVPQRNSIIDSMVEEENLTMDTVMQAVTAAANNPDLPTGLVDRLMRVGGDLPHVAGSRCGECRRLIRA